MKKNRRSSGPAEPRGLPGKPPKLEIVGGTPRPASALPAAPEEHQAQTEWLSERDFTRTLELVDRTCKELRASEARADQLRGKLDAMRQETEEKLEAAEERIRRAEERAMRAEDWAKHVEERAVRAEARATEAEQRADALEEWADTIQGTIEELSRTDLKPRQHGRMGETG
jgi:hypothetical protein